MRELPGTIRLTVAGDGPDLLNLKRRFGSDPRTQFLGTVASDDLPMVLSNHDVLIMPSRFEGFGLSLAEAMAAGCVPVASRIAGVTDAIVEHDNTGFLFPVGNWREAARYIRLFADRPDLLAAMSARARQRASQMFDAGRMAASYAKLITTLTANPPQIARPLLIEGWRYPSGMRSGLRTFLPAPIKNVLREARERFRVSTEAV
jgi:glycosyltransferase involved in cell wall biosynthesis